MPKFLAYPVIITAAAAPSSPVLGQMYFNTTTKILYVWDGAAWDGGGGGSSKSYITRIAARAAFK